MCRWLFKNKSGAWRGLRIRALEAPFEKATKELEEFQTEDEAKNLVCSGSLELNAMDGMGSCSRNCPGLV